MMNALPAQVAVVGLGYVGLPLAAAFGRVISTVGFDIDPQRIQELNRGDDRNKEVGAHDLRTARLKFTNDPRAISQADCIIVSVPTPIDKAKRPDLTYLVAASQLVGQNMKRGAVVVYESTVYPGCTEEVCIPVLERESGLKAGDEFKVGYSPERMNPGDAEHTMEKVVKVVSGQDEEAAQMVERLYRLVAKAGVHRAPNIKTAEAAKVLENIQRDVNIALMNEVALLFHRIGLDAKEVLKAAGTKWNFVPFEPGLVGGYCIPVVPYYLTHKAEEVEYYPEVILAARRVNDSVAPYIADETMKLLIRTQGVVRQPKVLVLGAAFKENVGDARVTQTVRLVKALEDDGAQVYVYDPLVGQQELDRLGFHSVPDPFDGPNGQGVSGLPDEGIYDAVILAVPHDVFRNTPIEAYKRLLGNQGTLVDIKGALRSLVSDLNVTYWSL